MSDDFIYVEQEWGSLFYKHIGKRTKSEAKILCSNEGPSVHLPIPRFHEEHVFYLKHFSDEQLWLDLSYDVNEGIQDANGHWFIRFIRTLTKNHVPNYFVDEQESNDVKVAVIKYHDWINLAGAHDEYLSYPYLSQRRKKDIFMDGKNDGDWDWTDKDVLFDSVCVYDIIPDENCAQCPDEFFCRYIDNTRKETNCDCQKFTKGETCEVDLCSHCQNGGYCDFKNATKETQCICPYPFFGKTCEGKNLKKFLTLY